MILDGVMYLETGPSSGAVGVGKAAVSRCAEHPNSVSDSTPADGSVELIGGAVAAGIGYTWG